MKLGHRQRWMVFSLLLTLALSAAAWVRDKDQAVGDQISEPVDRKPESKAKSQTSSPSTDHVSLSRLRAHRLEMSRTELFSIPAAKKPVLTPIKTTLPPVATPPVVAPVAVTPPTVVAAPPQPPPPSAPPLPFKYLGKLASEEIDAMFLTHGERNLIVHAGDVIDQIYRIDRIAGSSVQFTHLPTGIQQTLAIGEAK